MPQYAGHCHCGAIEWTVDLPTESERHVLCHCPACKSLSGGEFTLNQIIPKKLLTFTKGQERLRVYTYAGDSGNKVSCFNCSNCGASPYHHQHVMGEDTIVLRTGLLEGSDKWGKPAIEIYDKFRLSWLPQTADVAYEMGPSE